MNDYLHYDDHNHDYPNTVYDGPQPIEEGQLNEKPAAFGQMCKQQLFFENWNNHGISSYESYTNLPTFIIPLNHFKASYYNFCSTVMGRKMHMGIDMGLSVERLFTLPLMARSVMQNSILVDMEIL